MSTAAEKAAARRAKILARGKDRMAMLTGGMRASDLPTSETTPDPADVPLSQEKATAEIDRALDAILNDASVSASPVVESSPSVLSSPPGGVAVAEPVTETVADPHEFLSAADAASFSPPPSPSRAGRDSQLAFSSFASASNASAASAAARRREKEAAALRQLDENVPTPPSHIEAWRKRVTTQMATVSRIRAVAVSLVMVSGVLAGLGWIDGGLMWLLVVELLAASTTLITDRMTSKQVHTTQATSRPARTAAAPRAAPSTTASTSSDDPDIIDVDTDAYRAASAPAPAADPFAQLGLSGFSNMPGMSLPPALDTTLKSVQMVMKYAAAMKTLMHDAMIFVFTSVCVNAVWQLTLAADERIIYTNA